MHYAYDFNYSITLDHIPTCHASPINEEKGICKAAKEFAEAGALKGKDMKEFVPHLVKQNIFIKIGNSLLELSQIEMELIPKNLENMGHLESLREELCEDIKQMNVVLGRERQYYINLIILALTIIIAKSLKEKHDRVIERWVIFHLLHWELKGQHSTNAFYQRMAEDLLIQSKINAYIEGTSAKLQQSMNSSMTFKQMNSSLQAMKIRQSSSGFALALNKQNQNLHNKTLASMLSFKKQAVQGKESQKRPNLFERCCAQK